MPDYKPEIAVAVIGLAGFQLLQAWNANAPKLAELRSAKPDDISVHQKLQDADILVGGAALMLGVSFAVMTKNATALVLMLVMFGSISFWNHAVLNGESK